MIATIAPAAHASPSSTAVPTPVTGSEVTPPSTGFGDGLGDGLGDGELD